MQPTAEQQQAIDLFATGGDLAIEAGAGTGKTSTLVLLAQSAGNRRGQYLAFNKALVDDNAGKFPLNSVACNTAHSLAYRALGHRYGARLRSGERVPGWELAKRLRINPIDLIVEGKHKQLAAGFLAGHVTRAIGRFCQSADQSLSVRHFPYLEGLDEPQRDGSRGWANNVAVAMELLPTAAEAWADLGDVRGWRVPFKHEHYLKLWQLDEPAIDAQYILFDEAQDANPVIASVVAQQALYGSQLVYVGDSQQEIYAWTGAVNALAQVQVDHRTFLTQSFRFGQAVADEANKVLDQLHADLRLTGNPAIASRVETVPLPKAILTRTNAHGIERLLELQRMGRAAHYLGGSNDVLGFAKASRELQDTGRTAYPELACFATWAEVLDYVAHDEDGQDLALNVRLIQKFGVDAIIEGLERMVPEARAEVVISTAHKSKGRQWSTVQIAPDFRADPDKPQTPEALRLKYVALTRAQEVLDIDAIADGPTARDLLELKPDDR